jgi:lipopolysaccharide assembly protein B
MLELLFLLLPVAAFYGYVMGIRSARKNSESQKISQLGFYTKGINYFLHRDKDKAVDEFIRYYDSKVDHSFEEGIALGNLFRERGELDRAIKFHTGLMTKDGVEPAQRSITLLELAKDFKRAGLLDKAEEILFELISYNSEKQRALQLLLKVYEQEKEWHKALNLISSYRNVLAGTVKQSEAEFLCEIASDEFANHVYSKAIDLFKKALSINPECFRAGLSLAKIEIELGHFSNAIDYLVKTSELDIEMIGLLVKPLRKCFDANNYEQHMAILNLWLEKSDSEAVVLELANIILETKDKDSAEEFLMRRLKKTPNISLFTQLLNYRLSELDGKSQERLAVLKSLIEIYQAKNPRFICHKCGFKSNILFWQCPSCHGWEKMKPNNKLNLD